MAIRASRPNAATQSASRGAVVEAPYVRRSSGLLRELPFFDMFLMNASSSNPVGIAVAYGIFYALATFPRSNVLVALVLAVAMGVFVWVTFALVSATLPRVGGDYLYGSRSLHPIVGMGQSGHVPRVCAGLGYGGVLRRAGRCRSGVHDNRRGDGGQLVGDGWDDRIEGMARVRYRWRDAGRALGDVTVGNQEDRAGDGVAVRDCLRRVCSVPNIHTAGYNFVAASSNGYYAGVEPPVRKWLECDLHGRTGRAFNPRRNA
jgi:amino acid transporter